jgi:hypothetical protein
MLGRMHECRSIAAVDCVASFASSSSPDYARRDSPTFPGEALVANDEFCRARTGIIPTPM